MPANEQQVRERAYFIWEGEGRVFGRAIDHWTMAEAEFRAMDEARVPMAAAPSISAKNPAKTLKPRSARAASAATLAVAAKAEAKTAKTVTTKAPAAKGAAQKPKAKTAPRRHTEAGAVLH